MRPLHNGIKPTTLSFPRRRAMVPFRVNPVLSMVAWIPAFAGMTIKGVVQSSLYINKLSKSLLKRDLV